MSRELRAQSLVLESLLTGKPLPGMARFLGIPELQVGSGDGQLVLVDERPPAELGFPSGIRILSRNELESLGPNAPRQYLEFQPPEHFTGTIGVRVRLSVAFAGRGYYPAAELIVTFEDSDPLTIAEPTHVLAF